MAASRYAAARSTRVCHSSGLIPAGRGAATRWMRATFACLSRTASFIAMALRAEVPDDGDRGDVLAREPAEVVRHAAHRILQLALGGEARQLQVHLVEHPESRRADRVAEALEAAVDLAWCLPRRVVEAVQHVLQRASL